MRFSYEGDVDVALGWRGAATQALFRFRAMLHALGLNHGSFQRELDENAYCIGHILPSGIESLHIIVQPVETKAGEGGGLNYFEFGTSGWPLITYSGKGPSGITYNSYKGCVVSSELTVNKDGGIDIDPQINTGARVKPMAAGSKVGRMFQVQLMDEPVGYANPDGSSKYRDTIYTTYNPINPYTGIYYTSLNNEKPTRSDIGGGSERSFSLRDVDFDVPFQYGIDDLPVRAAVLRGDADWPRASGVQTVGSRRFAIYVDANATVWAFPVEAVPDAFDPEWKQLVPAELVRSAKVEFPTWAFVPSDKAMTLAPKVDNWFANNPDLQWKLNHLGTKMCCVVHEREAAIWDDAYLNDPDTRYDNIRAIFQKTKSNHFGATGLTNRFGIGVAGGTVKELYTFGRGLIEIAINIKVTGSSLANFTLSLITNVVRTPRESDRCTFMAGYAWHDVKDKGVAAGDLLLLDIERWYQPSESKPDPLGTAGWRLTKYICDTIPDSIDLACRIADDWIAGPEEIGDYCDAHMRYASFWDYDGMHPYPGVAISDMGDYYRYRLGTFVPFVTGRSASFFSLRKQDGTELSAISGDALLAVDFKTASFAIAIEHETTTLRTVPLGNDPGGVLRSGYPSDTPPWPATTSMPYLASHPAVAIYTQATLREVLMPDGAEDLLKGALDAKARVDPRSAIDATYAYMPANDLRDWSGYSDLRDVQMYMHQFTTDWPARLPQGFRPSTGEPGHPMKRLSVQDRNWWLAGMCVSSSNPWLLFVSNPNFGWACYTAEIINRTQNMGVTFFTHPNGSWAYYDATRIYNSFGVPHIHQQFDDNSSAQFTGKEAFAYNGGGEPLATALNLFLVLTNRYTLPGPHGDDPPGMTWTEYGVHLPWMVESQAFAVQQMRKFMFDSGGPVPVLTMDRRPSFGNIHMGGPFHPYVPLMSNVWNDYNTMAPVIGQGEQFKHQIFDRIHLQMQDGGVSDSRFVDWYNAAARKAGADLAEISTTDQRAALSLNTSSSVALTLNAQWPSGHTFSISDRSFKTDVSNRRDGVLDDTAPAGSLLKPRLTSTWNGARILTMPPTFSTCLLLET